MAIMAVGVQVPLRVPLARVAQLVEHDLAKVGVAGSSPVSRSEKPRYISVPGFFYVKTYKKRSGREVFDSFCDSIIRFSTRCI
jgi:hypothetical protein